MTRIWSQKKLGSVLITKSDEFESEVTEKNAVKDEFSPHIYP